MPERSTVLCTTRLSLRWLVESDAAFMLDVWNDPAFVRFVGDRKIRTVAQAEQAIREGAIDTYRQYGYGPFLVTLAATGQPIGLCGLFRRSYLSHPDLGFALLPAFRSSGYAREAAVATIEYARDVLHLGRISAIVSPCNQRSVALLGKLGFRQERDMRIPGEGKDVSLYSLAFGG